MSKQYDRDYKRIINGTLTDLERTNILILDAYKASLKDIKKKIDSYNTAQSKGFGFSRLDNIKTAEELRLNLLYTEISKQLTVLTNGTAKLIENQYVIIYQDVYYQTSYLIEREVNTVLVKGGAFDLVFPVLDVRSVRASFNDIVAGETFKQRTLANRKEMQAKIQKLVARAIIQGQSEKDLNKALKKLDDYYVGKVGSSQSTARTELLKAHSLGNEMSSSEAIKSGVTMEHFWDAALDINTRPQHAAADGRESIILSKLPAFYIGQNILTSPRLVHPKNSANAAGNVINCRCFRIDAPFGIKPTKRVQKLDEEWVEVDKNDSYDLWVADLKKQ
jgi:hypothetical protein